MREARLYPRMARGESKLTGSTPATKTHDCRDGDGRDEARAEMQRIDERNGERRQHMSSDRPGDPPPPTVASPAAVDPGRKGVTAMPQLPLSDGSMGMAELAIEELAPAPFQHRIENAEALQELAESLKQDGQLGAIIVRAAPAGAAHKYQIVAGHRRMAALKLIGSATVRAEIRELDDEGAFRSALIDNMKRHDLDPLDEARTFHYGVSQSGWTPEQIAEWIGRPRDFVAGRLRLLKLDPAVMKLLEDHVVSTKVAELLQTVAPIKGALPQLIKRVEPGDSLREVENEVAGIFRTHSIDLDADTPFAWKEECGRLGCLAKDPRGKPVCFNRENYVRLTVELNKEVIAAAVARFRAANAGAAAPDLPVYYDLSGIEPGWKRYDYKAPAVKGFPGPPRGAAAAKGLLVEVPGTRSAFAQGKITVNLLKQQPKTDSYGYRVQTSEAKAKNESRAMTRRRQALALQPPLKAAMMAAVDALAKKPARALAAGMVTRYRVSDDLQLVHDCRSAMEALHIKLPLGKKTGDGLVTRLAALGEAKLVRIIAAAKIWKLDDPFVYSGDLHVISAKRLKGQLPILLGEKAAAVVLRDVEDLQQRMAAEAHAAAREAGKAGNKANPIARAKKTRARAGTRKRRVK